MDLSIARLDLAAFYLTWMLGVIFMVPSTAQSSNGSDSIKSTDTLTIVAFGNSITAVRKTVNQVFAQRIPFILSEKGIACRVINAGIGGSHTGKRSDHDLFKIPHALDRLKTDVLDKKPDLTIVGFGTNDSYIDSKVKGGPSRIPLENYQRNLESIITSLIESKSRIILIAPNILGQSYPDFQNKRLLQYVREVRKFARKYQTGLVDNFKMFKKYNRKKNQTLDDLMLDGVHPNDKGHELIANELVREILQVVDDIPTHKSRKNG